MQIARKQFWPVMKLSFRLAASQNASYSAAFRSSSLMDCNIGSLFTDEYVPRGHEYVMRENPSLWRAH
jgi:hypothetical protein